MTFMRKEIEETPGVVRGLLRDAAAELDQVASAVLAAHPRHAVIAARGTSDNAGIYARYLIETYLGLPAGLAAPSVTTTYRARLDWRDALVISFSQSGESPDIRAVSEAARAGGALTIAVTNEPGSPLAASADYALTCRAGRERAVAATKTYVAELASIAALVARLAPGTDLARGLPGLPDALDGALAAGAAWVDRQPSLVAELAGAERAFVVSRGYNLATALEIALKLKETSLIMADGYSTADLLHGPVALASPGVPMVVFRPDGPMGASIDEGLAKARAAHSRPWVVGGRQAAELARAAARAGSPTDPQPLVIDDGLPESLTPLTYALPGQLMAEAVARARGMNPDAPEGLTKVTRTN